MHGAVGRPERGGAGAGGQASYDGDPLCLLGGDFELVTGEGWSEPSPSPDHGAWYLVSPPGNPAGAGRTGGAWYLVSPPGKPVGAGRTGVVLAGNGDGEPAPAPAPFGGTFSLVAS